MSRGDDELPRVAAHHVRVFRVGEEYVEDHGQLRADDPAVTGASSVTVVDRRIEVPVVVETRIPSAEAGDFTVRACFYCTVTDPSAVVRDGVTDVEALLLAHLREVPGLTEDGSDLPVVDTAAVRARIDARLTAYHEMRPSLVSGSGPGTGRSRSDARGDSAHVEEMERARRDRTRRRHQEEMEQQTALDRALREAELELKHEEIRNLQALRKERNRQEEERLRTGYERGAGAEQQDYELEIERRRNRFTRAEIEDDIKLIGSDPVAADYLAWRNGDISADELSKRLHAAEERWDGRKDDRLRLDRDYEMTRRGLDREDLRWQARARGPAPRADPRRGAGGDRRTASRDLPALGPGARGPAAAAPRAARGHQGDPAGPARAGETAAHGPGHAGQTGHRPGPVRQHHVRRGCLHQQRRRRPARQPRRRGS